MNVLLANPRGFCAGVVRAIDVVEVALAQFGAPIYVRHEVVHNTHVVNDLRARGTVFVELLNDVPDGSVAIFSAHGVPRRVVLEARARGLTVFDATCPLVTKVHVEVVRFARRGFDCVVIGHVGHPEVEGTIGQFDHRWGGSVHVVETAADVEALQLRDPDKVGYVTQTTLSVDDTAAVIEALRTRIPNVHGPRKDDICYATQNRQDAVRALAARCDLVLVVGSTNSSNSNRLREIATRLGVHAELIDRAADIDPAWLIGAGTVGVTAGASAPEASVRDVLAWLSARGASAIDELEGEREAVHFPLPAALRLIAKR